MNIFVYGTLRVGEYNDTGFSRLAGEVIRDCTVPGRMFNVHGEHPIYPVVNFLRQGTIIGDLLVDMPERHKQVRSIHRMEIGAGYELSEVTATAPDGQSYVAIAYHFDTGQRGRSVGAPIEDGDWLRYDREWRERDSVE